MHKRSLRPCAAAVLAVAVALTVGCGGSGSPGGAGTGAKPLEIRVRKGVPVGGVADITAKKGDRIRFTVASDVADEVHLHGYDLMKEVPKGGSVSFDFPARLEGVFEAELERRKRKVLSLKVYP